MVRKLGEKYTEVEIGRNVDNNVFNLNLGTGREILFAFSKKFQDGGQMAYYYILAHILTSTDALTLIFSKSV